MIAHQPSGDTDSAKRRTCTERITIPTLNAEFIPEQDGGPCQQPAVLRVSIDHDGDTCGCPNGLCLFDPDTGNHDLAPWTEVLLLCADHADEYRSLHATEQPRPRITVETLS